MNGAALNRRFTRRMRPITGSHRPPAPKTASRPPSATSPAEPREGHQERDGRRDPHVDEPWASRPLPREDDARDDAEDRGLRMAERRQSEQDARANRRAPRRFPARLGRHEAGRQEGEDQAGPAGQAAARHQPAVGARHQPVGERGGGRGRRVQRAIREPRERGEAQDREGERSPSEQLDGRNPERLAERGRAEQGRAAGRRTGCRGRCRRSSAGTDRPAARMSSIIASHSPPSPTTLPAPTIGATRTTMPMPKRHDRARSDSAPWTRKILTSSPSNAGSAGRKLGCSPWLSTPAAPSQRFSGSGSPSPGLSTTTHSHVVGVDHLLDDRERVERRGDAGQVGERMEAGRVAGHEDVARLRVRAEERRRLLVADAGAIPLGEEDRRAEHGQGDRAGQAGHGDEPMRPRAAQERPPPARPRCMPDRPRPRRCRRPRAARPARSGRRRPSARGR